jgi:poly(3-hydroxybutyrate) depolymerase
MEKCIKRRSLASGITGILLALAFSGITEAQTNVTLTMQVGGKARHTVMRIPAGIEKPAVVFYIHGANGSGPNFKTETRADATADREKFIAVYPSASSNGAAGVWDDMRGTGNFPFFFAILDTLDARYKIDRNRVYMTGFSQGGFISFAAGCFYSDKFAAIAPVSGHSMTDCTLKRPVPTFLTFGATEGVPSFQADTDLWLKWNTCPSEFTTLAPFPASNSASRASLKTYGPCAQQSKVLMNTINGQGHQWPAVSNLNMADETWTFFKNYSLAATTSVLPPAAKPTSPEGKVGITNRSRLKGIEGLHAQTEDEVFDAVGKRVNSSRF